MIYKFKIMARFWVHIWDNIDKLFCDDKNTFASNVWENNARMVSFSVLARETFDVGS